MVVHADVESLWTIVTHLRTTDYRQVCGMMRDFPFWEPLPDEETFWKFATYFVNRNSKAFLGTFLKAMVSIHTHRSMNFSSPAFEEFTAVCITDIDCRKVIEAVAPLLSTPESLARFLTLLPPIKQNHTLLVNTLFHISTDVARFLFFKELKQHDDDTAMLRRYAVELIRRGDRRSFNLACILQRYFALEGVPGTFALEIPEYELSRLDQYSAFLKILSR